MKKSTIVLMICLAAGHLSAQPTSIYGCADREVFQEYLAAIEPYKEADTPTLLEQTALFFLGTPYADHTLEVSKLEQLTVNMQAFDCTTYVETVLALATTAADDVPTFETFMDELKALRYRNGVIDGYASRIHYATDWLYENEKRGVFHNISASLGGKKEVKPLHFMSSHRDAYKRLKNDDEMLKRIIATEDQINARGGYYYLPKERMRDVERKIPHMAVILFATTIKGLDVTHMGFAYRKGEKLTFLHASSTGKKVMVDELNISDYMQRQQSRTGIVVVEVNPFCSK